MDELQIVRRFTSIYSQTEVSYYEQYMNEMHDENFKIPSLLNPEHIAFDPCGSSMCRVRIRKPDDWLKNSLFQFPVVECFECGLVYVNPSSTLKSIEEFYSEHYHENRQTKECQDRYVRQENYLPDLAEKNF